MWSEFNKTGDEEFHDGAECIKNVANSICDMLSVFRGEEPIPS